MRRTYRSKKDTTNVIERRDLFQNLGNKSSAYDAFSIQNIKQTKRELSCVASSNPLGVASSRVRKKKFVKRIIKEIETCPTNKSSLEYLTPDKSIRVNKPLDPFDILLLSSPAQLTDNGNEDACAPKNEKLYSPIFIPKKQGRTYVRRKPKTLKKFNCSSSNSNDSDKENSDEQTNKTSDMSDIRTHKLLVEQEVNRTPKTVDDSINNMVNNISLLNKLKNRYNTDESINKSLTRYMHRLTRTVQSPLLQKSPLCSTPFKAKYRGESIYKFSPIISTNADKNPKCTPIVEDNNGSNHSIVLLDDNKDESNSNVDKSNELSINEVSIVNVENVQQNVDDTVIMPEDQLDNIIANHDNSGLEQSPNKSIPVSSVEISMLQTTETEPFLGFGQNANVEDEISQDEDQNLDDSCRKSNHSDSVEVNCEKQQDSLSENDVTLYKVGENSKDKSYKDNISADLSQEYSAEESQQLSSDRESLYDTCDSETSASEEIKDFKEPIVLLKRMNDSSFMRHYEKVSSVGDTDDNENSLNSEYDSFDDNNDTKYSTESESEVDSESSLLSNNSDEDIKSNDSDESYSHNEITVNNISFTSNVSNSNNEVSSSDICDEEDKCISFVTTRRKNEVINNSIISMFNDSCCSSSTDCDKTVLSVERKTDINKDVDNNITIDENSEQEKENNTILEFNNDKFEDQTMETDPRISFVTTRRSNITVRKSSMKPKGASTARDSMVARNSTFARESFQQDPECSRMSCFDTRPGIVLQPGKKWERSLSIYRRMTMSIDYENSILDESVCENKGRKYRQSIISTMEMQDFNSSLHNESINSRRSTFVSKPSRSTIRIVKDANRLTLSSTTEYDDLKGFLNEECDDTIIELSKLSIADQTHEVTVLDNFHDTSNRIATARDYVLRRCNQTDAILFDECYPDTVLKNCHKIGEGVYGEVFLWRDRDGRARVLKIVPIAGNIKVNGESQKDFHEIISEIVIAMELSALRAPIAEIESHFDAGKDVEALDLHAIENATDIFNEVLAVRCVYGSYPSRLLDLWDLYDECKGSENDNPAILPVDQQYIVLELANAGQDLESYQFNNAEQAHALFLQVAYGLAVGEEAFQFEHRDLHWGNVLISPTEQKSATVILRGRSHRVPCCGVRATIIDYSLSRVALRLPPGDRAALYNDLATDDSLFDAVGDYQFQVYRLMRDKLGNEWKNFEPYTNILWLHYTVDKMITALRYKRVNTKIHKHYIDKLKGIKSRILEYGSAALFVLTDNEI